MKEHKVYAGAMVKMMGSNNKKRSKKKGYKIMSLPKSLKEELRELKAAKLEKRKNETETKVGERKRKKK